MLRVGARAQRRERHEPVNMAGQGLSPPSPLGERDRVEATGGRKWGEGAIG
jgi:hypothetical protein